MTQTMQQNQHKVTESFRFQGLKVPENSVYRIVDKNDERVNMERTSSDYTGKKIAHSIYISPDLFAEKFTPV